MGIGSLVAPRDEHTGLSTKQTKTNLKTIFLFRHGETDYNKAGRMQGHLDIPLNQTGREQARNLGRLLRESGQRNQAPLQVIYSSDLSRAHETAVLVALELGAISVHTHPGLREAGLGQAQGMMRPEARQAFGEALFDAWAAFGENDGAATFPGGESGDQVFERALAALQTIVTEDPHQRIGIATHGGVIRRLLMRLGPQGTKPPMIENASVTTFSYDTETKKFILVP